MTDRTVPTEPTEGWPLQYTPPPNEWHYSHNMSAILCPSAKGGERIILDMRGWGYLTGKGHGALGLDSETAAKEQDALALFIIDACKAASPPAPVAEPVALPPIETDPHMPSREYIPLPGGWEIQTKGTGSSYRICDTKTGERRNITETYLHNFLTRMAKEVHAACSPIDPAAIRAEALNPDMPAQEMRLHMGEMTAQEMRTARAAIRWANSRLPAPPAGGRDGE